MKPIEVAVHVDAPLSTTFDIFSDIEKAEERIEGIKSVEFKTDQRSGVGTVWTETRVFMNREATETMEITALDPDKSYVVGCESCGCRYATTFTFTEENGGTTVLCSMAITPLTMMAKLTSPLSKMMSGMIRKCLAADFATLKACAEGRSAPTAAGA